MRSQQDQEDYGIDFEIEFNNPDDTATGTIFKVQLKGHECISSFTRKSFFSHQFYVSKLNYYLTLELPVVLVIVDCSTEKIYWRMIQNDETFAVKLKKATDSGQEKLSVRFDSQRIFQQDFNSFVSDLDNLFNWLRINAINRITEPISNIFKKTSSEQIRTLLESSKQLNFHLYNERFERLRDEGEYDTLVSEASSVFNSFTETVETRFSAGIFLDVFYNLLFLSDPVSARESQWTLYQDILTLVRKNNAPYNLRLYAIMLCRSAKLGLLVESDLQYTFSVLDPAVNIITKFVLNNARATIEQKSAVQVVKSIQLLNRIMRCTNHEIYFHSLSAFLPILSKYVYRLRLEKFDSRAANLEKWIKYQIEVSIGLAKGLSLDRNLSELIILSVATMAVTEERDATQGKALASVEFIKDSNIKKDTISILNTIRHESEKINTETPSPEDDIQAYRAKARALGFNLSDPSDAFTEIINIGLADYNPERILKNCEFLFMFPTNILGIPAQMLSLPTAAPKWLFCTKINEGIRGYKLDDLYHHSESEKDGLYPQYCENCEFKSSRPSHWKWSREWQIEHMEKYSELINQLNSN